MAKFSSASKQAVSVVKSLQSDSLKSVGTVRNYEQALTRVAEWTKAQRIDGGLRALTVEQATHYIEQRGQLVGQKTLDMERQAIQSMFQNVTNKLGQKESLHVTKSETQQVLKSRAYTQEQVNIVSNVQTERHALATEIAHAAGLRAHELLTLAKANEQPMDKRPALSSKFEGREGQRYTVQGKGGLVREVVIPTALTKRLELRKLDAPRNVIDRNINYQQRYDLANGQRWSNSFSAVSKKHLNWSGGAHGLRHSYAQERMKELQSIGHSRGAALEIISQEMGHFRPEITETYLR